MNRQPIAALPLLLFVLFFSQCEKEVPRPFFTPQSAVERLVFGQYHRLCPESDCVENYLLVGGTLYADNKNEPYHPFPYEGSWSPRPNSEYRLAARLLTALPPEIWQEDQSIYGAPGVYDQGGYFIEVRRKDGQHRAWRLDTEFAALPAFIQPFARQLAEVLATLPDNVESRKPAYSLQN